jgi:hypothetical protein
MFTDGIPPIHSMQASHPAAHIWRDILTPGWTGRAQS